MQIGRLLTYANRDGIPCMGISAHAVERFEEMQ